LLVIRFLTIPLLTYTILDSVHKICILYWTSLFPLLQSFVCLFSVFRVFWFVFYWFLYNIPFYFPRKSSRFLDEVTSLRLGFCELSAHICIWSRSQSAKRYGEWKERADGNIYLYAFVVPFNGGTCRVVLFCMIMVVYVAGSASSVEIGRLAQCAFTANPRTQKRRWPRCSCCRTASLGTLDTLLSSPGRSSLPCSLSSTFPSRQHSIHRSPDPRSVLGE